MNQNQLRDIKPPVDLPPNYLILYIILAIVLVLIALAIFMYFRQRKKQAPQNLVEPPKPWDVALERLSKLSQTELLSKGLFDEFYTEMSDIVRQYFEGRFEINAPEMTTEEFMVFLKDSPKLNTEQKEVLKEFLESCDMVKFAKFAPQVEDAHNSLEFARNLVEETREKEEPS